MYGDAGRLESVSDIQSKRMKQMLRQTTFPVLFNLPLIDRRDIRMVLV